MSTYKLNLNQPFVSTLNANDSYQMTIPATGQYTVQIEGSAQQYDPTGSGSGSGKGLGAGPGGGEGFTGGDLGPSHGGVGQGFGPTNGYSQNASYGSNQTSNPGFISTLATLIQNNGNVILSKSPLFEGEQKTFKYKVQFQAGLNDPFNCQFLVSGPSVVDHQLNGIKVTVTVMQGWN